MTHFLDFKSRGYSIDLLDPNCKEPSLRDDLVTDVLARAKRGEFAVVARLTQCANTSYPGDGWSGECLLCDAAPRAVVDDLLHRIREDTPFVVVDGREHIIDLRLIVRLVAEMGYLDTLPLLTDTVYWMAKEYVIDPDDVGWFQIILFETLWSLEAPNSLDAHGRACHAALHERLFTGIDAWKSSLLAGWERAWEWSVAAFGDDRIAFENGLPVHPKKSARRFLDRIRRTPADPYGGDHPANWAPRYRRKFEAQTGLDLSSFFINSEFQSAYASAWLERFLADTPDETYRDGIRYFFGHAL